MSKNTIVLYSITEDKYNGRTFLVFQENQEDAINEFIKYYFGESLKYTLVSSKFRAGGELFLIWRVSTETGVAEV